MTATDTPREIKVDARRLIAHCQALFVAVGMPAEDAAIATAAIVEADLRGVPSHGARLVPSYVEKMQLGGTNPRPDIRLIREGPAVALLDADHGMGHVAATRGMDVAIDKARACGIGACTIRNSNHFGMAAVYAIRAMERGLIGFATGNSSAIMPPPGGSAPRVGNNATAYALPAGAEPPLILDVAMSVVARARIGVYADLGQRIPEGWALDAAGNPTTDPLAALKGGMLYPIGGHKGFGLALLWDALSGVLSGGSFGTRVRIVPSHESQDTNHFLMAIDISYFGEVNEFRACIDEIVRNIRSTPPALGGERVRAPGEQSHLLRQERLATGVPLLESTAAKLNLVAEQLGLDARLAML